MSKKDLITENNRLKERLKACNRIQNEVSLFPCKSLACYSCEHAVKADNETPIILLG